MNDLNADEELDDELLLLDLLNCSSLFSSSTTFKLFFVVVVIFVTAFSPSPPTMMEFFVFPEKFIVIKVDEFALFFLLKLPSFSFISVVFYATTAPLLLLFIKPLLLSASSVRTNVSLLREETKKKAGILRTLILGCPNLSVLWARKKDKRKRRNASPQNTCTALKTSEYL